MQVVRELRSQGRGIALHERLIQLGKPATKHIRRRVLCSQRTRLPDRDDDQGKENPQVTAHVSRMVEVMPNDNVLLRAD